MKKVVSYLVAIILMLSVFSFFSISIFSVKAEDNTRNIYDETNTYDVDDIIQNDRTNVGEGKKYENPQFIITYKKNKNNQQVANSASVTVFTHGYGCSPAVWSNAGESAQKKEELKFAYDSTSIVQRVASLYGNNYELLWAKMTGYESFSLKKLTELRGLYENAASTTITSSVLEKHIIILFEATGEASDGSNNNAYFQLNYMLSKVLYELKNLDPAHKIPKVNLIGHSRGGLTNLQYALDHPDIVENLISLGTPYLGTTSATVVKNFWSNDDGFKDIIDPSIYNDYLSRWNNGYNSLYKSINAVSIGAFSTLPFLGAVAHNDKSGKFNFWSALGVDAAVAAISAYKYATLFTNFFKRLAVSAVTKTLKTIFPQSITASALDMIFNEIQVVLPFVVWFSDVLVPLNSQLGIGLTGSYSGFKHQTKMYTLLDNTNFERIATWNPPVVHNLEPYDTDIIEMVVDELKESILASNFEYVNNSDGTVSISGYNGEIENGILNIPAMLGGKTVTKIESNAFANEEYALARMQNSSSSNSSSNALSEVTTINIPSSVQEIKSGAFKGLENLVSVNFASGSNLTTLGENAFAYCEKLKNINLPSGITKIPMGAFEMCKELESISLPSGVTEIGAQSFSGCEKLAFSSFSSSVTKIGEHAFFGCKGNSTIALPDNISAIGDGAFAGISQVSAFTVSTSNTNYSVKNGVLYSKDQAELIQYPKAKTDTTFTANPSGTTAPTRTIKPYAFYDCDNLTLININYVFYVESFAFAHCSALTQMYALGIMEVSLDALANTSWLQNQLNTKSQAVLGNLLIAYVPEENKKVMELSDWSSDACGIAEQAFISTDLETIYVPSRVSAINNGAFANLTTLKNVYFENITENMLASLSVSGRKLFENNHADLTIYLTRSNYQAIAAMGTNAFTGINKQILSTTVNCVKNGVTTQQTLYYDESYTLDTTGDVIIWEDSSGRRYLNTGTWKCFESEITLNALETNESWLYCDNEDISPVALVQGDVFSISYTAEGVITVIVNGETYTINRSLPIGIELRRINDNNGITGTYSNVIYNGQFTKLTIETDYKDYLLEVLYYYYEKLPDGAYLTTSYVRVSQSVSYLINDLSAVNAFLAEKGSEKIYNNNNYYVFEIYDENWENIITALPNDPATNTTWKVECVKIMFTVTFEPDHGKVNSFVQADGSTMNTFVLPTLVRGGYSGQWKKRATNVLYDFGATVNIYENTTFDVVWTAIDCNHVFIYTDTGSYFVHKKRCPECGYEDTEGHSWESDRFLSSSKCTKCRKVTIIIPVEGPDSLTFYIFDESGNLVTISREQAIIYMREHEIDFEQDIAA